MSLSKMETVLLCGVNVVRDVVTVLKRNGSNQAIAGFSATLPSHRHPSLRWPADTDAWLRYERPAFAGAGHCAPRAGRLGCPAEVSVRLRPTLATAGCVLLQKQEPLFGPMRGTLAGMMRRS